MCIIIPYKRFENESDDELIYRICEDKEQVGSWQNVADIINELLGNTFNESTYRKKYQYFKKMLEANESKFSSIESQSNELMLQRRELERMKIQLRDERNAWQKQNYTDARVEQKLDYLENVLKELGAVNFPSITTKTIDGELSLVVCLSDLHIGQTFDNNFGKYDTDIAKDRLSQYLKNIKEVVNLYDINKIYIASLGDQISGNIHTTIAITNRENVIDQIKIATELISSFCYECLKMVNDVYYYSVSGNHSRITKKDDALKDERLDDVIAWAVGLSLSHIDSFHNMTNSNIDTGIAEMNIYGCKYILVHGDNDAMTKQGVSNLSMMLGYIPNGIYRGHMHYPAVNEINGITVVQSGSLPGCGDDHTIESRLYGKPSQTMCVHSADGIKAYIPITLK